MTPKYTCRLSNMTLNNTASQVLLAAACELSTTPVKCTIWLHGMRTNAGQHSLHDWLLLQLQVSVPSKTMHNWQSSWGSARTNTAHSKLNTSRTAGLSCMP
jgi:hypothetical protein